jgi:thiamine kinase-like enzyme
MTSDTGIPAVDAIVARTPMFSGASDMSVEALSGGLTNVNYLLTVDGERFVVRVAGQNTSVLGIDREREAAAVHHASFAGIAPETVAFLLPEGHSVSRFLDGARPVTIEDARTDAYLQRIARRLRDIHELDPIAGEFDPYGDIERWLVVADERGVPRSSRLDALLERVDRVRLERSVALDELVLCHNDSYYQNVLDDGSLWVIDWEYAGMGDPFFDLAANAFELDARGKDVLVEAYFGEVTHDLRRTLDDAIAVFLAWNVAWSMVQIHESEVDHDYLKFAEGLLGLVPRDR